MIEVLFIGNSLSQWPQTAPNGDRFAHLRVDDPLVSPVHLRVAREWRGQSFMLSVEDLGSEHGTYYLAHGVEAHVGYRRLRPFTIQTIMPGDRVKIGKLVIPYEREASKAYPS